MTQEKDPRLLSDRRRALEEEFFAKQSRRQLEELRARAARKATREELAGVCGVSDERVLDRLAELGVTADTLAAVCLVPLVEVAWANGKVEEKEKEALLAAARDAGVDPRHPAYALLERWLFHRPEAQMFEAWRAYVKGLCQTLDVDGRRRLRDEVLGRARRVAEAAGGFLGLRAVSAEEQAMLGVLARAFEEER